MPLSARANPHLRLTAAILVAVFAALAGSLEADQTARGRRGDLQTVVGGIRLVAIRSDGIHHHGRVSLPTARACACRAEPGLAGAQVRVDRSGPTGVALLRTTALPPPVA